MADKTLQVRLSDEQWAQLEQEAIDMDRPMSWVARRRMFPGQTTTGTSVGMTTVSSTKPQRVGGIQPAKVDQVIVDEADPNPFGSGDRQEEMPVATDEATAVITRSETRPRRPGEYTASEMADIDAERLARMKTGKKK